MSYTAIVLDRDSVKKAFTKACDLNLLPYHWEEKLHHCTLAMGGDTRLGIGSTRILTVTHYGVYEGHVTAFKVLGAQDSVNKQPHITIAVAPGCKPVESNNIVCWTPIENFQLSGKVEICK